MKHSSRRAPARVAGRGTVPLRWLPLTFACRTGTRRFGSAAGIGTSGSGRAAPSAAGRGAVSVGTRSRAGRMAPQ